MTEKVKDFYYIQKYVPSKNGLDIEYDNLYQVYQCTGHNSAGKPKGKGVIIFSNLIQAKKYITSQNNIILKKKGIKQ